MKQITSSAEFRPYGHSDLFRQVYRFDSRSGRFVNTFSVKSYTQPLAIGIDRRGRPIEICDISRQSRPLVIGSREDLRAEEILAMQHNLLFDVNGTPAYLFGDHNYAAYACAEAEAFGVISRGATLLHFDAHADMEECSVKTDASLEEIYQAFDSFSEEDRFIWYLVATGRVSTIYWFSSSAGLLYSLRRSHYRKLQRAFPQVKIVEIKEEEIPNFDRGLIASIPRNKLILDIDYDYFRRLKWQYAFAIVPLIGWAFSRAGLVTQALSPFYIKPKKAVPLACGLMLSASA